MTCKLLQYNGVYRVFRQSTFLLARTEALFEFPSRGLLGDGGARQGASRQVQSESLKRLQDSGACVRTSAEPEPKVCSQGVGFRIFSGT